MKKISLAHICAYLSLAVSITIAALWCCNAGGFTVVSLDTFVGVIVALLAIIVTIAVGWQIYNSIELKNKIEELNSLKVEFQKQKDAMGQLSYKSKYRISLLWGFNASKSNEPIQSFRFYIISLANSLHLTDPSNVNYILDLMDSSVKKIGLGFSYPDNTQKEISEADASIKETVGYKLIAPRYNKIFEDFHAKINNDKK